MVSSVEGAAKMTWILAQGLNLYYTINNIFKTLEQCPENK